MVLKGLIRQAMFQGPRTETARDFFLDHSISGYFWQAESAVKVCHCGSLFLEGSWLSKGPKKNDRKAQRPCKASIS